MEVLAPNKKHPTKCELATELGFDDADYALPQGWLDNVVQVISDLAIEQKISLDQGQDIYQTILGGTLWEYKTSFMGAPLCVTEDALTLVNIYFESIGQQKLNPERIYRI